MKISHAVMVVLSLGVISIPALGEDKSGDVRSWQASSERDVKAGTIKDGVLRLSMDNVSRIQHALVARGHVIKEIDGTLNGETTGSLKKLQAMNKLKESGDLELASLNVLGFGVAVMISTDVKGADFARSEMARASGEPVVVRDGMPLDVSVNGQGVNEPLGYVVLGKDEIKAIQKRFKSEKLFSGETDGNLTTEFIVAVRTFQTAKGLKTASLIDLSTLAMIPEVKVDIQLTGKLDPREPGDAPRGK